MPDDQAGRWLTLAAAGRALGLTPDTLRKQAKRGLRDARRDNHGRWLILVQPEDAGQEPEEATWHVPAQRRTEPDGTGALQARAAAAEALVGELRRRIDELAAELQREREEHRAEASDLRAERDRLLGIFEALAAERRQPEPPRRPWPGLKAWIRRVWEGER